ncbi:MAG: hypothetical protein IKE63_00565 [Bacilli bacterium]|nr:hypothetical protein [Bacilli bacterium]
MNKLFIYYSLTNNGDVVADFLKEKGYEIRKVIPKNKYPKNRFLQIMIGGYKASFNKKDKLLDFDTDINNYEKVVIGSPIWNDRLSAPINTVINLLNTKNISFVLYSASGKAEHALEKIKSLYEVDAIVLKEPKKHKEELEKLKDM